MPDDHSHNPADKPDRHTPGDNPLDSMASNDVERAMDQADALLAEAVEQIGDAQTVSASDPPTQTPDEPVEAVEQQLDALEAMLSTGSRPDALGQAQPSRGGDSSEATDVAEELTDAPGTSSHPVVERDMPLIEEPNQAATLSEDDLAELDEMIASSVDAEIDGNQPQSAEVAAETVTPDASETPTASEAPAASETPSAPPAEPAPSAWPESPRSTEPSRFVTMLWTPAAVFVRLLDVIDRRAGKFIGPSIKQAIGYVAIGTLVAAGVLIAWALLKP